MTRGDWPIIWRNSAPAELATDILRIAIKRGQCCAYVHGDRMLLTDEFDQRHADDCAGIFTARDSCRAVIAKLVNAFDAAMEDMTL